ncbi:MAG: enoyl-CoA hydratase [Chloroflexi bacterium]|nr:enoyl-CoA hydratase [Chloroflexota bacterium]
MPYTYLIIERPAEGVALVRLNRPKQYNALNLQVLQELAAAFRELDQDDSVRAIVITGNDKAFAAGADIKEMMEKTAVEMKNAPFISGWDAVALAQKPVIAAVSGYALGGGAELAWACDMIIASETAVFGQPEINLGIIPGAGGTQRLARTIGKYLTMEMVLNDRRLTAQEAAQFGLVNHVFPVETYLDEAIKLAAKIASRAPLAVRFGKEAVLYAFNSTLDAGLQHERLLFYTLFCTEDQKEGMHAFVEKRKPRWKGA